MSKTSQVSVLFVALLAATAVGLSEAAFFIGDRRTLHLLVSGFGLLLAAFSALGVFVEVRGTRGLQFTSAMSNVAATVLLGWLMYFVLFLCLAIVAMLIGAAAHLLKTGNAPSLESSIAFARRLGAACVFASLVPPVVMMIAVKLGFKPHGDA